MLYNFYRPSNMVVGWTASPPRSHPLNWAQLSLSWSWWMGDVKRLLISRGRLRHQELHGCSTCCSVSRRHGVHACYRNPTFSRHSRPGRYFQHGRCALFDCRAGRGARRGRRSCGWTVSGARASSFLPQPPPLHPSCPKRSPPRPYISESRPLRRAPWPLRRAPCPCVFWRTSRRCLSESLSLIVCRN